MNEMTLSWERDTSSMPTTLVSCGNTIRIAGGMKEILTRGNEILRVCERGTNHAWEQDTKLWLRDT